ncbi:sporulation protein YlmC with PRC-barrel domain [Streptomyces sp. B3I7]|uniref:PRC-barrel domain-containing protein n=1 Tax=Streptomyces sp. B3I7 TaxID=3042269 RepID=UPI00278ADB30|nr:PRC-barrel domain-containing protein [Streptomyces sp. B3I7]MDQ0814945.1 sporulation protein YlmC with PRC-barrel domain [Streptomyces sp. B3I7]
MTLYSHTVGLPVVTLGEAAELGTVVAFEIDVARGRITGVRVSGRRRRTTVLPWEALHAVGSDAVLVRSAAEGEARKGAVPKVVGLRVLSEDGEERGTVTDLAFDAADGRLEKLLTDLGEIPAGAVRARGGYAWVVRAV